MKLGAFVLQAIPLIMSYYVKKYMDDDKAVALVDLESDFGIPRIASFDFIVVGGGSAGCVVAGRLSEKFNVLLLEAGGTPVPQSLVPLFTRQLWGVPDIHFNHKTVPQRNLSLGNGGIVSVSTGKMLGGSGSHNDMVHQRASPLSWDAIAARIGDVSWSYQNLLGLFKKSEDFIGQLINPDESDYYGTGGPLTIDTQFSEIFPKWAEAGVQLGYPTADPNAFQIPSFAPIHKSMVNGKRVSSYTGYISPYEGTRTNLTVIRYATVNKVLLTEGTNQAYGVTYTRHGIPQIAHASKEVILSAGTINSPLILMLSGIGPKETLDAAKIPVKVELPLVGQNLIEHIYTIIPDFTYNASAAPYIPRIPEDQLESAFTTYLETGVGEFSQVVGPQAFISSSRAIAEGEGNWPDIRINFIPGCPISLDDEVETKGCAIVELERPKSVGTVSLNVTAYLAGVTDFDGLSEIDINAFSDPSDMDVFLDGMDMVFRVVEETEAFQSLGTTFAGSPLSRCSHVPFRSREYWACYVQQGGSGEIRQGQSSTTHIVGTCSMGSVTDSKMRVLGVPRLRVVDASILPIIPNANVNGPVVLVGEKAAEDIALDWSNS